MDACGEEDIVLRDGVEGTGSRMSAWSSGMGITVDGDPLFS